MDSNNHNEMFAILILEYAFFHVITLAKTTNITFAIKDFGLINDNPKY